MGCPQRQQATRPVATSGSSWRRRATCALV